MRFPYALDCAPRPRRGREKFRPIFQADSVSRGRISATVFALAHGGDQLHALSSGWEPWRPEGSRSSNALLLRDPSEYLGMTAGQSPTTTCGRTVWGSLRLRLALRALRLFAASGLRRFLRLLFAHQHALLRLFLVRLDRRGQAASRERGQQFLRTFERSIGRQVLPDLNR